MVLEEVGQRSTNKERKNRKGRFDLYRPHRHRDKHQSVRSEKRENPKSGMELIPKTLVRDSVVRGPWSRLQKVISPGNCRENQNLFQTRNQNLQNQNNSNFRVIFPNDKSRN